MINPYTEAGWRELCRKFGYSEKRIDRLWQRELMRKLQARVDELEAQKK